MALLTSESGTALPAPDCESLARTVAALEARLRFLEGSVARLKESPPWPSYVTVDDLARVFMVNESTVVRLFKKHPEIPRKYVGTCLRADVFEFAKAMPDRVLKWSTAREKKVPRGTTEGGLMKTASINIPLAKRQALGQKSGVIHAWRWCAEKTICGIDTETLAASDAFWTLNWHQTTCPNCLEKAPTKYQRLVTSSATEKEAA